MFVPPAPPVDIFLAPPARTEPAGRRATDGLRISDRWDADRLGALPVPAEALRDCRETLVRECRECPDFRDAVGSLIESGPDGIAEAAGRLHGERFDRMLSELVAVARACGTPFADAVDRPPEPAPDDANPLRPVVKRLAKRGKLRDSGGVTLPLIVGRSLSEWARVCTGTA